MSKKQAAYARNNPLVWLYLIEFRGVSAVTQAQALRAAIKLNLCSSTNLAFRGSIN
jgi:hypothetical protein